MSNIFYQYDAPFKKNLETTKSLTAYEHANEAAFSMLVNGRRWNHNALNPYRGDEYISGTDVGYKSKPKHNLMYMQLINEYQVLTFHQIREYLKKLIAPYKNSKEKNIKIEVPKADIEEISEALFQSSNALGRVSLNISENLPQKYKYVPYVTFFAPNRDI